MSPIEREWLNVKEAAEYLGVSRVAIYGLMERGMLPYTEILGLRGRRIRREDLDALISRKAKLQPPTRKRM